MINEDDEYLDLLATFHYVLGGLAGLFSLFPVIHLVLGIAILTGRMGPGEPEAAFVGWVFIAAAIVIIAIGMTFAVLIVTAGRNLKRRTRHTFCLVIAGIECAFVPLGTVLGVFTLLVLQRPSVKQMFGK